MAMGETVKSLVRMITMNMLNASTGRYAPVKANPYEQRQVCLNCSGYIPVLVYESALAERDWGNVK
jgi:hypothetical protein